MRLAKNSGKTVSAASQDSRPNQRQKFLADYYRARDTRPSNPAEDRAILPPAQIALPPKTHTLTYSTEGTTDENFSDIRQEDSSKCAKSSFKTESDCLTIINLCTDKLQENPLNEKALSLRATAYIRRKDYPSVSFDFGTSLGNEGHGQVAGTGRQECKLLLPPRGGRRADRKSTSSALIFPCSSIRRSKTTPRPCDSTLIMSTLLIPAGPARTVLATTTARSKTTRWRYPRTRSGSR